MDTSARATGYDLFKLIVALILLLIFICLIIWFPANAPQARILTPIDTPISPTETSSVTTTVAAPIPPPTGTLTPNVSTVTAPPLPSSTETSASSRLTSTAPPASSPSGTSTSNGLTATFLPITSIPSPTGTASSSLHTATAVLIPSPTGTNLPTPTFTPLPFPTDTPVVPSTLTPIVEIPADTEVEVCDAAISRSRLQAGRNATILRRLNFRTSAGIRNNWVLTNMPGTQVEIIDGPVCLPHSIGAYLWWQIKLPDGRLGWSAEASLFGKFYFIEPNP